jgi:hypothetical protein
MKVYVEWTLENWEEFKALIEFLQGHETKYELHTAGSYDT